MTVTAVSQRLDTRLTAGLAQWTPEQIERRDPVWVATLLTWLSSAESKGISGRVFVVWGDGFSVAACQRPRHTGGAAR